MIDYRDLLLKYISYVVWNEGVDFIGDFMPVGFTEEETKTLQILSQEAKNISVFDISYKVK